jgi:hypothetical protein
MDRFAGFNKSLDEMLVQLGGIALRLSSPLVTRTPEERRALARSVHQYSACAAHSADPRVHRLRSELEAAIRPRLRLVVNRQAPL